MATTALTGGKWYMETEFTKLFTNSLMTCNTDITVPFGQKSFLHGVMGKMTGKTITLDGRSMAKGPLAILIGLMAFRAEHSRLSKQTLLCCLSVTGMTVETSAFGMGFMAAAHLGSMLIRMALQTDTLRTRGQQMFIFTGMGIVTGGTVTILNRFMNINGSDLFIDRLMTGDAKFIRFLRQQQTAALTALMAGGAFAGGHGAMNLSFK